VRDSCTAVLALIEAGDSSYCVLYTTQGLVRIDGSHNVRMHPGELPKVTENVNRVHQNSEAVKTTLMVADELLGEGWDLINSVRMALYLLAQASIKSEKCETDGDFVQLAHGVLRAVKYDICLCSHLRSRLAKDAQDGDPYFCDLTKSEMKVVVEQGPPHARNMLERVELRSKIQSEGVLFGGLCDVQ
jgi:hypothetical protein